MAPSPKSLSDLETQHAATLAQLHAWQAKASSFATERGMDLPTEVSSEEFFDWLEQHEQDEMLEGWVD